MMVIFFFVVQQIFMLTFFGLKFYMIVKNFSFAKWVKTIFRNFQLFAKFCNIKTDR